MDEICERSAAIDAVARPSRSEPSGVTSNVACEIPEGVHGSSSSSSSSSPSFPAAAVASFFVVLHQTMRIKLETCMTLGRCSVPEAVAGGRHDQTFPTLLERFREWSVWYRGFG